MSRRFHGKSLFCYAAAFIVAAIFSGCMKEELLRVHFISVGFGDCYLVDLPASDKKILIDAGGGAQTGRLVQYLKSTGINNIDEVFLTDTRKERVEGLKGLLQKISVGKVYVNGSGLGGPAFNEVLAALKE